MRVPPLDIRFALCATLLVHTRKRMVQAETTSSSFFAACGVTSVQSVGDGSCDSDNNNEGCQYDGGDCCPCTCEDGDFRCGASGFDCQDPTGLEACSTSSPTWTPLSTSAVSYDREYPGCSSVLGFVPYIGDGFCDSQNNNEECGYDGGDCCACTCVDDFFSCGANGYECTDPAVSPACANALYSISNHFYSKDGSDSSDCSHNGGTTSSIADGWCDSSNNNEGCEYDGGDCCPCTCMDDLSYSCGQNGYDCRDPAAPIDCPDFRSLSTYTNCNETYPDCEGVGGNVLNIGTGYCTWVNNNEECGYDGGDCCSCTCVDGMITCGSGGYDCQDPTAPTDCFDATSTSTSTHRSDTFPDCEDVGGDLSFIGSGFCTSVNNNVECGYDGGDCCPCTCVDGSSACGSGGYDCQDPTTPTDCSDLMPSSTYYDNSELYPDCEGVGGDVSAIGNGYCLHWNNNEECGFDGGDCCACTCVDGAFICGHGGYDCQNPMVPTDCSDVTSTSTESDYSELYPDCDGVGGDISAVGNGYCTSVNNIEECGYDGGDCCPCTCVDGSLACGSGGYNCQDPAISADCLENSDRISTECVGNTFDIGNGVCDVENNNVDCEYDGGDCCACTCVDPHGSACGGHGWYDCQDPGANCSESAEILRVAIGASSAAFALFLCCYAVSRPCVLKRMRHEQIPSRPESALRCPSRVDAIPGVVENPTTKTNMHSVKP